MATKSSIIIFYLRLSRNTHEWLRAASWVTLGVVNVAGIFLTFFNVFQCIPVSRVFAPVGKCIPLIELYLASAPVNILTDIAVLVLPIPVLTGIQLPRKQKTILVATFGLGLYVIATDIIRIFYLQESSSGYWDVEDNSTSPLLGNEVNFAWYASLSFLWSAVEVNVGMVCACVPTLKPLIGKIWPTLIDNKRWSSCFWASTISGSSTTAASYLPTREPNRQMQNLSPITPPRPVMTTNTSTLFSSRGQYSSFATETIRSLPPTTGEGGEAEIEMLDFVTSPGMDPEIIPRASMAASRTQADVYFGFLSIKRPRSMLRINTMDSIKYCMLAATLLLLSGFAHGLWNNLNNQISKVSKKSMARTLALYSVYYGAYFFGPTTVGQLILRKLTFKATFIIGLCIYGTGTFMYWPSAVLLSFPGFLVSGFFVGFGLSIVELGTDTFLTLCGPAYYGDTRLLIGQGIESGGQVIGMVVASKGLFQSVDTGPSLLHIQWIYLGISLFSILVALVFYYLPLPEATDDELEQARQPGLLPMNHTIAAPPEPLFSVLGIQVTSVTLVLGYWAHFIAAGVLLGMSVWFTTTLQSVPESPSSLRYFNFHIASDASSSFGRFVFGGLCFFIPPPILLLMSFVGAIIFQILIFSLTNLQENSLAGLMIITHFFVAPLWPLIFSITLRGMGRRTKMAAALLTSAQGGAAIVPWMMYAIITGGDKSAKFSYCLAFALLALGTIFPIYLLVLPSARQQVDRGDKKQADELFEHREWPRSTWDPGSQAFRSQGSPVRQRTPDERSAS